MLEIISSLDFNKAIGINSIPIKILKLAKEQIAEDLCLIYSLSFITSIFPESLKIVKVLPVYEIGIILWNRPISLLSNLNNIIEKLMHKRLLRILNDQKVLYKKINLDPKNKKKIILHMQ